MKQRKVRHSSNRKIRALFARARVHVDRVLVSDIVATTGKKIVLEPTYTYI